MFESVRKNSQSFMLIVLIAALAGLFATQFGPGSRGCASPQSLRVNHIARVYGNNIAEQDFQSVARLTRLSESRNQRTMRQAIVDGLVERELLAHEAERLGFRVDNAQLNREIQDGYYYISLGSRQLDQLTGGLRSVPLTARQRTIYASSEGRAADAPPPTFAYDDFETWVRNAYGRTVPDYKRLMTREMLAERMRNVVMAGVRVSEDEVWRDYERQHNQVAVRYVQFSPEFYRTVVRDDDQAALDAFAAAHVREIQQQYEARHESLEHLPAQVRIRQIRLDFPDAAEEPAKLATQQRAEALRARIIAGADFVRIARLYSQDVTWRAGGESGWIAADRVDVPDDVKRLIPNLQPGQTSEVIRSPLGVHIVQVLGRRQGDVSEADAKREIARELYRIVRGNELSAEASARAQQLLAAPGATLDSVAATLHTDGLTAFYRGEMPPPETLAGNNALEPVSHSDVGAPELRETQPFTQGATIPGIEHSEPIVAAAFRLTDQAPTPAGPITAGDDRFLIRLKDGGRQLASREEFNREKPELMEGFTLAKRREALQQFLSRTRAEAERNGQVRVGNSPLLQQQRAPGATDTEEQGTG